MIITQKEIELIASTPKKECFICEEIINNINYINGEYIIDDDWLIKNEYWYHLRQIIGR